MEIYESRFEQDIETSFLTQGGYTKGSMEDYDKQLALNVKELVGFIKETQPKAWERYQIIYPSNPEMALAERLDAEIKRQGLLAILRKGFKDRGVSFKVVYFKPETSIEPQHTKRYEQNRLQVIRQFYYSPKNNKSIDMVLMLNGIPIVALELKGQLTGQTVDHAIHQWKYDRNPYERVFHFNQRILVYFAVDLQNAAMATKLAGKDTYFLPFNQGTNGPGNDGGAGNPANEEGYMTSYLWETVLERHSLLMLLQRFLNLEVKEGKRNQEKKETLIFPRYHQYDVVENLIHQTQKNGPGENRLIQHSAGSGKSYSIAWLAHRLSSLHDKDDVPIYSSVIVVTDRRVLDQQLQEIIRNIDHTEGVVEPIDDKKSSRDLQEAIEAGKKIIITTLQKFPFIVEEIDSQAGRNFAVIVDEAHSSQSGKSAQQMKDSLADADASLEKFAELENQAEDEQEDSEDKIAKIMATQGRQPNLSFFGFTATPKRETLEVFGQKIAVPGQEEAGFQAHHIYSMRQAIEEGFILDVLQNYMTYEMSYQIINSSEDNPEVDQSKAARAIGRYASLHGRNIQEKTEIMIEHFMENTRKEINGQGKAMVVTASRKHAVRYFHAFNHYIKKHGYQNDVGVLVAFSGEVEDKGNKYTEASLNKTKNGQSIKSQEIPNVFNSPEFNILIVAEKYQTGFDQPLLHTMFVDKRLRGIRAVQTLSRLNRIAKDKKDTFVLDFVNEADDIQFAFEPYYQTTQLDRATDVNEIYSLQDKIHEYMLYNQADVDNIISYYFSHFEENKQSDQALGILVSKYHHIVNRYLDLSEDERDDYRIYIRRFVKAYHYITQLTQLFDDQLEKEYHFLVQLNKLLPKIKSDDDVDIREQIELEYLKLEETFSGDLSLKPDTVDYQLQQSKIDKEITKLEEEKGFLNDIIESINQRFDGDFSEENKIQLERISEDMMQDQRLENSAKANSEKIYTDNIFTSIFEESAAKHYREDPERFMSLFQDGDMYEEMKNELAKYTYKVFRRAKATM